MMNHTVSTQFNSIDGQIYFIKNWHLREFGFPRVQNLDKQYKWKKMNYTTDLPKHEPVISYLVATGQKSIKHNEFSVFRMHVSAFHKGTLPI